ncbi:hypothetical protein HanXRQr2_Chr11g0513911 [Helianthus annuus]|uniref:Uncharacterized protein n=1 Tax=Helianthus annuus TaxID=4232 RepID=A0A9K3HSN0_HELAN|nr:hypothetical protein HanXRQr2_Chr11g0513911 [Helianthus annuus]
MENMAKDDSLYFRQAYATCTLGAGYWLGDNMRGDNMFRCCLLRPRDHYERKRFLNTMKHGDDILHRLPVPGTARGRKRVGDDLGTFPKHTRILGTGQKQVIL